MSDMSSMNRERKKRELKRQMISTPGQAQAIRYQAKVGDSGEVSAVKVATVGFTIAAAE